MNDTVANKIKSFKNYQKRYQKSVVTIKADVEKESKKNRSVF